MRSGPLSWTSIILCANDYREPKDGWTGGVPNPLGSVTPTVSDWAAWVCCGLRPEQNSFPVFLPGKKKWVPGVFLDTPRGKELTANQGSSKRPEDDPFPHVTSA